jgi:hypothetical protein
VGHHGEASSAHAADGVEDVLKEEVLREGGGRGGGVTQTDPRCA